uniref:Phospholipase A2 inhibitor and Ly6/PLAUR domain-containing protein-like n=1 Tax=Geotrypetes seraphini TaxID=260995 RepID=A0A6P8P5P9_GEOSA|nr:phospholipase A2 inhibitor and Ly6/PLAUR domain-containing protein-like [Geotrypetes seraphini]
MRTFLTSICIIFALTATGLCLNCDHCLNIYNDSCSGVSDKCKEDETVCVSRRESATTENNLHSSMFKGCMKYDPNVCDRPLHTTSIGFDFYMYNKCCKEDNCNRESFTVPPLNLTENGLECPVCHAIDSYDCTPERTIKCVGNQDQCYVYSGELRNPSRPFHQLASRGCIVSGSCEFGPGLLKGLTIHNYTTLNCM